jgi:hypothetical protein
MGWNMEIINKIQNNIIDYDIRDLYSNINDLTKKLISCLNERNKEEIEYINEILKVLFTSMENRDYLFLNDILSFELLPYLKKVNIYE